LKQLETPIPFFFVEAVEIEAADQARAQEMPEAMKHYRGK